MLLGVAYAVLVAISRVVVHAHSVSEAVSGCVLGLAMAFGFMWQARGVVNFAVSHALALASLALMVLITFKAEPMPTEDWLQKIALKLSGHERIFSRADWQAGRPPLSLGRALRFFGQKNHGKWYDGPLFFERRPAGLVPRCSHR